MLPISLVVVASSTRTTQGSSGTGPSQKMKVVLTRIDRKTILLQLHYALHRYLVTKMMMLAEKLSLEILWSPRLPDDLETPPSLAVSLAEKCRHCQMMPSETTINFLGLLLKKSKRVAKSGQNWKSRLRQRGTLCTLRRYNCKKGGNGKRRPRLLY